MSIATVNLGDQLVNVRQKCRKAPIPMVCRAYSRALREWCQQTWWLRLTLAGTATIGQRNYTLGTDTILDISGVRAMSITQTMPDNSTFTQGLDATDSSQWNMNLPNGLPLRYCYLPEGGFALDPIPDQAYGLTISMIVIPKESTDPTFQIPAEPLVKYSNDIEDGALGYLLEVPGTAWANPQQAALCARRFQSAISNGKAEVQRAFNSGSVRARYRPFGVWGV